MAIHSFLVTSYALNVYAYGNRTFEGVPAEYHEPVKKYAAANYSDDRIKNAADKGWITQKEYAETLAYKYPDGAPQVEQQQPEGPPGSVPEETEQKKK